jgi:hypothetical protein
MRKHWTRAAGFRFSSYCSAEAGSRNNKKNLAWVVIDR